MGQSVLLVVSAVHTVCLTEEEWLKARLKIAPETSVAEAALIAALDELGITVYKEAGYDND